MKVGEAVSNLKNLRQSRGLKQKELADILGITSATYSRYETGKFQLNQSVLYKLVKYFNVSSDFFIGITDIPEIPKYNENMPTKTLDEYLDEVMKIELNNTDVSKVYVDKIIKGVKLLLDQK